jgi:hypothetical protein
MPFTPSRRAFATLAASALTARPALAADAFDLTKPLDQLAAYVKARASLDGAACWYHYQADCFGIPDGGPAEPLFRREGVSVHKMTFNADRSVNLRYTECNYTLDNDAKPITTWVNPFTKAEVPVRNQAPAAGTKALLTSTGARVPDVNLNPPSKWNLLFRPPMVSGDRIWFTDDIMLFRTSADAANFQMSIARPGDLQLTEFVTFEASLAAIQNPALKSVPATASIAAVVPWMPWLGMQDIKGRMMLRYLARKVTSVAELPASLTARINADHPGFLANPKLDL